MIDLRSDTVTEPDEAMREASRDAAVGDDVYGEDPTVNDLEGGPQKRSGRKPRCSSRPVRWAIRSRPTSTPSLVRRRSSSARVTSTSTNSAVQPARRPPGANRRRRRQGIPTPQQIESAYVEEDLHRPGTGLCCLENTHNARGGVAIAPERLEAAANAARERDVLVHLDGARVFNAAVALDVSVTEITQHVDSVMFCLSKGLGAPIGSMLAGPAEFVERARRTRKLFGGGMRQVGVVAAPGLRALENVDDLETDHENARVLAEGLRDVDGFAVQEPETNIVLVDVSETGLDVDAVLECLRERDVLATPFGPTTIRFCTHRTSRDDIERVIPRVEAAVSV